MDRYYNAIKSLKMHKINNGVNEIRPYITNNKYSSAVDTLRDFIINNKRIIEENNEMHSKIVDLQIEIYRLRLENEELNKKMNEINGVNLRGEFNE